MKNLLTELIIFALIVLLAYLIKLALKDKSDKAKNIPFIAIAVVLLVMEAVKQIQSLATGYNLYYLPFQICSLFLLSYPMMALAKGKVRDYFMCISLCLGCSASFGQVFLSQILTRDYIYKLFTPEATLFHYHTVFYHHIVILHFMLMIFLKPYKPRKRDILSTTAMYAVFMVIACIMANVLQTNFSGYINYGAAAFDYFKKYGQFIFNIVGFCLNTLEYLLGVLVCFLASAVAVYFSRSTRKR
ncbi:hypothetical protein FACS1894219_04160 [Clostridia bacterium]|nr:hypothetical protein FACS1894219_04160 [Clostridia bacterium]